MSTFRNALGIVATVTWVIATALAVAGLLSYSFGAAIFGAVVGTLYLAADTAIEHRARYGRRGAR